MNVIGIVPLQIAILDGAPVLWLAAGLIPQ